MNSSHTENGTNHYMIHLTQDKNQDSKRELHISGLSACLPFTKRTANAMQKSCWHIYRTSHGSISNWACNMWYYAVLQDNTTLLHYYIITLLCCEHQAWDYTWSKRTIFCILLLMADWLRSPLKKLSNLKTPFQRNSLDNNKKKKQQKLSKNKDV